MRKVTPGDCHYELGEVTPGGVSLWSLQGECHCEEGQCHYYAQGQK